ncbi:MAG: SDR family NAD(P)-dependent oxidoreductase, partial [Proteobacteria bacterium]|nr:SDR family NAD(P)-dependent oxidoreductase [Pseudomonadota bacterium]
MDSVFAGCGYVGRQVARRERDLSGRVFAVVRSPSSAERLIREGIQSIALDLEEISILEFSLSDKVLYWFAPPQPEGTQDRRLRRCLELAAQIGQIPNRIVLINTTGVYGDCQGDWVTETRPRRPQTGRATRRVDAEDFARSWCDFHAVTLVVLRVPGIYGLGKLPLDRIKNARPVLTPELCPWSNRVHVEDLITACMSAARVKAPAPA